MVKKGSNARKKAAREIAAREGIMYTAALRRLTSASQQVNAKSPQSGVASDGGRRRVLSRADLDRILASTPAPEPIVEQGLEIQRSLAKFRDSMSWLRKMDRDLAELMSSPVLEAARRQAELMSSPVLEAARRTVEQQMVLVNSPAVQFARRMAEQQAAMVNAPMMKAVRQAAEQQLVLMNSPAVQFARRMAEQQAALMDSPMMKAVRAATRTVAPDLAVKEIGGSAD